ncbi:hypothetical protein Hypma_009544 [Hypsizygus marmoreus]|uniref:Uncharacterized protein n=1 Tax=Hypsizygus marmoreus TaxID=39966 RepID=A0A369JS09_HYPMA|nr:hypothetical protein Hypma_009544 [Hypsizygus marmoreus]
MPAGVLPVLQWLRSLRELREQEESHSPGSSLDAHVFDQEPYQGQGQWLRFSCEVQGGLMGEGKEVELGLSSGRSGLYELLLNSNTSSLNVSGDRDATRSCSSHSIHCAATPVQYSIVIPS